MSFYGDIKRVQSSPFVFDKYYSSRTAMEEASRASGGDGVYIGRYVLIKYTYSENDNNFSRVFITANSYQPNKYYLWNSSEEKYELSADPFNPNRWYYERGHWFNKYVTTSNSTEPTIDSRYTANATLDQNQYRDTFDGTIWQKIYTNVTDKNNNTVSIEKYIMVAELNAAVPRLEMEVIGAKHTDGTVTNGVLNETWNVPSIKEESSSEDSYLFEMPDMLHLSVGDLEQDFCAQTLIDEPYQHYQSIKLNEGTQQEKTVNVEDMFSSDYNYVGWVNKRAIRDENGNITRLDDLPDPPTAGSIDGKELDIKLYAVGRAVSLIYDILYGTPPGGGNGLRPFFTEHPADVLQKYEKGLIGILTSINTDIKGDYTKDTYDRDLRSGMYYYFVNKWVGAEEDSENFIENIPKVVGSSAELTDGKAHFRINFAADSNYVVNTTTS